MPVIVGGTNDGWCQNAVAGWAAARDHAGYSFDSNNSIDITAVSHQYFIRRGTYIMRRAFFEFDTSGISVVPSAATLKIQGVTNATADVIAVRSEQGATLAAGDFNSFPSAAITALGNSDGNGAGTFAGISGLTYSAEIDTWTVAPGTYNDIALNATALADMASLSLFKVCLMHYDRDYLDIDGGAAVSIGIRWAENGDTKWPYIDYTAGVAVTDNATFFGANF
jgi:hypothetical protein